MVRRDVGIDIDTPYNELPQPKDGTAFLEVGRVGPQTGMPKGEWWNAGQCVCGYFFVPQIMLFSHSYLLCLLNAPLPRHAACCFGKNSKYSVCFQMVRPF